MIYCIKSNIVYIKQIYIYTLYYIHLNIVIYLKLYTIFIMIIILYIIYYIVYIIY